MSLSYDVDGNLFTGGSIVFLDDTKDSFIACRPTGPDNIAVCSNKTLVLQCNAEGLVPEAKIVLRLVGAKEDPNGKTLGCGLELSSNGDCTVFGPLLVGPGIAPTKVNTIVAPSDLEIRAPGPTVPDAPPDAGVVKVSEAEKVRLQAGALGSCARATIRFRLGSQDVVVISPKLTEFRRGLLVKGRLHVEGGGLALPLVSSEDAMDKMPPGSLALLDAKGVVRLLWTDSSGCHGVTLQPVDEP